MNTLKIQVEDTRIISTRYDESEVEEGWLLCEDFPQELIYDPFDWFYINGEFVKESEEDIEKREEKERFYAETLDISDNRKMELLLASIPTLPQPRSRAGYLWKMMYNAEGQCFGWEEVVDPYYYHEHKGTYTDPIPYVLGDTVTKYTNPDPFEGDGWYSYEGDVKVCIKNGTPTDFNDEEYFAYSVD